MVNYILTLSKLEILCITSIQIFVEVDGCLFTDISHFMEPKMASENLIVAFCACQSGYSLVYVKVLVT